MDSNGECVFAIIVSNILLFLFHKLTMVIR